MTKKFVSAVAGAAIAMAASSAFAADLIVDTPAEVAPAATAGDWYVSLFAGGAWTGLDTVYNGVDISTDFDTGYTLGIAVGTHVFDNLRGEVELSGGSSSATSYSYDGVPGYPADGSLSTLYLLGNLWYELDVGGGVKPYIGGGVGVGLATSDVLYSGYWGPDGSQAGFAYQLGAGITVDLADGISADIGYRFKSIVGLDFEDYGGYAPHEDGVLTSHVLQAGLTFKF